MQLSEVIESHIAMSLEDMRDPTKFVRWGNGERAKEEAEKIVAAALAEKMKTLEQGKAK